MRDDGANPPFKDEQPSGRKTRLAQAFNPD
jgi:hypothetical protein